MKSKRFTQQVAANVRKVEAEAAKELRKRKAETRQRSEVAQRLLSAELVERHHEESIEDWRARRRAKREEPKL